MIKSLGINNAKKSKSKSKAETNVQTATVDSEEDTTDWMQFFERKEHLANSIENIFGKDRCLFGLGIPQRSHSYILGKHPDEIEAENNQQVYNTFEAENNQQIYNMFEEAKTK